MVVSIRMVVSIARIKGKDPSLHALNVGRMNALDTAGIPLLVRETGESFRFLRAWARSSTGTDSGNLPALATHTGLNSRVVTCKRCKKLINKCPDAEVDEPVDHSPQCRNRREARGQARSVFQGLLDTDRQVTCSFNSCRCIVALMPMFNNTETHHIHLVE